MLTSNSENKIHKHVSIQTPKTKALANMKVYTLCRKLMVLPYVPLAKHKRKTACDSQNKSLQNA
jgi:hypothetical protein